MARRLSRNPLAEAGWILLVLLAGVIVVAADAALPHRAAAETTATAGAANVDTAKPAPKQVVTVNWAGYELDDRRDYRAAAATWKIPRVPPVHLTSAHQRHVRLPDASSSVWVGLGGGTNRADPLIQAGTDQNVIGGKPEYHFWWELYPASYSHRIPAGQLRATPGHTVRVAIRYNKATRFATFRLEDVTVHRVKTLRVAVRGAKRGVAPRSAEWVVERPLWKPTQGKQVFPPLSSFGAVSIKPSVTFGTHGKRLSSPAVSSLTLVMDVMQGCDATWLAKPGEFSPAGRFNVTWSAYGRTEPLDCGSK
jgi:hypothetical protein